MLGPVNSCCLVTLLVLGSAVRCLTHANQTPGDGDRSISGPEKRDEGCSYRPPPEVLAPNAPEPDRDNEYKDDSSNSLEEEVDDDNDDDDDEKRKRSSGTYDYKEVLHKSILFLEAQRSGKLPANNRIKWRGDSGLDAGNDVGVDLTGGWYDAGDCMKFNYPMAFSVTILGWGLTEFWEVYEDAGELGNMLDSIRWPCEYLMKSHPNKNVYYYAVGDVDLDHKSWERPENSKIKPVSWKCEGDMKCADVAAEASAALATCAIVFARESEYKDADFSEQCLDASKSLFAFAKKHEGTYQPVVDSTGQEYYRSTHYYDELAWASLWLYMATGSEEYIFHAIDYIGQFDGDDKYINYAKKLFKKKKYSLRAVAACFSWSDKRPGVQLLLYRFTKDKTSKNKINSYIKKWSKDIPKISTGLSVRPNLEWGTNRIAANSAFVALMACHYNVGKSCIRGVSWARSQIHHILGDAGHSYVVGFGENPPTHVHHRGSSCPVDGPCGMSVLYNADVPNPNELTGAVVGGPDAKGYWEDLRTDYIKNEVTTYYNAGFQSAVAALRYMEMN